MYVTAKWKFGTTESSVTVTALRGVGACGLYNCKIANSKKILECLELASSDVGGWGYFEGPFAKHLLWPMGDKQEARSAADNPAEPLIIGAAAYKRAVAYRTRPTSPRVEPPRELLARSRILVPIC